MIEAVIRGLITLCFIVLAVFLVIWVLGALGIVLPAIAIRIVWIVVGLIAVLILYQALKAAGYTWLP